MLFPIVATLLMSFTDFGTHNVTRPLEAKFVGFDSYVQLFGDDKFLKALFSTAYFVVVGVPLTIVLGLLIGDPAEQRHRPGAHLLPRRLLRPRGHDHRRRGDRLAVRVSTRRTV